MRGILRFIRPWITNLFRAAKNWWIRGHANEAAALAFYSLFSLIPILIIGLTVASWIVDRESALKSLLSQTTSVTGFSVRNYLHQVLSSDVNWFGKSISPIIGGVVLAFSATKVITELRRAFSKVFGKPRYQKKSHAAIASIVGRLTSLLLIVLLGLAIATAVIYETLLSLAKTAPLESKFLFQAISVISPTITLTVMTLLSAVIMRWLPTRPPKFKEALLGGLVSSILIIAFKIILTAFLAHAHVADIYGSALTLVLILLWIYFAMQAILYGAEFAATLANKRRAQEDKALELLEGGVAEYEIHEHHEK